MSQNTNAPDWWAKPCNQCSNGRIMPDCSLFCSLTMRLAKGRCEEYNEGRPSIYLIEKLVQEQKQGKVKKPTTKVSPKIKKQVVKERHKIGKQSRLFEL